MPTTLPNPSYLQADILAHQAALKLPNTALIDTRARAEVGPRETGMITELADREIRIVGTFSLGTDFAAGNGNLLMSDQNFLRYFAFRGPEEVERSFATVDLGLLKVAPGTDVPRLVKTLSDNLPQDILVLSKRWTGWLRHARTKILGRKHQHRLCLLPAYRHGLCRGDYSCLSNSLHRRWPITGLNTPPSRPWATTICSYSPW